MDIANSIIGFVKDFGPTVRKYVKYQIHHNTSVSEFQKMQKRLKDRQDVIEANLKTQLKQPGKITNKEVETWLEEARQEIVEEMIEDLICKGGWEKYTNDGVSLVIDDHSIQYCASVFEDKQKEVKHQREKIEANLKTQLMQPGKIAWKEVEDWQEKASQQIAMKVEVLISQGECSSSTNIEQKIEELKRILEKGKEFTNDGVSLVIDGHSKKGVTLLLEKCIARDDVQEEILQLLRGDKVTRIAVSGMGGVGKTTIMKQVHNQPLKEPKFDKVIWVKNQRTLIWLSSEKNSLIFSGFRGALQQNWD
ncbi:hypothetical protein SLEP1_g46273 [Rubroshorea leprosula]|uniref:NB-ARC domain-containing protein n=1 Tax=Rubroshorea leprosula TaxID=152421 RepID=A0AAV5LMC6_9ROSI|nr:hypothetical protein SLEP1_g46273 [Rubroshorea leprosula]